MVGGVGCVGGDYSQTNSGPVWSVVARCGLMRLIVTLN